MPSISRRQALKGLTAQALCALCLDGCGADRGATDSEDRTAAYAMNPSDSVSVQYGFLLDSSRCKACGTCIEACRVANALPQGAPDWRFITQISLVDGTTRSVSSSCMHCGQPSCVAVCPTGALSKGAGGVVVVDQDVCIGCKYCYQACPYGVPRYTENGMGKCDCCLAAGVALGSAPHCVLECPYGALTYGAMEQLAALHGGSPVPIAEENNPSCLVVGADSYA